MTTPPTNLDLDEIEGRAAALYEYATLDDEPLQADANQLTGEDVPALLAEVHRLRAELARAQENYTAYRIGAEGAKQMLANRVTELETDLKRYVGAEPTIAEQMAYLSRCFLAVHQVCDEAEQQATRWEHPLPVPEWVATVRAAAFDERDTTPTALPWAHAMDDSDLHLFLDHLVSAALGRWHSDPEVPDRTVLADIETACAQWRTPGQGLRSDEPEAAET